MARNEGFKYWSDQEFVQGFDANSFLMSQSVMRFDDPTDRDVSLARSLVEGMISYTKSTTSLQLYDGTNWVSLSTAFPTDHGTLTGLGDDDHSQYHNDARGDARYYTQSQVDTSLSNYYTQSQADTLLSGKLSLSGGTLTGNLDISATTPILTLTGSDSSYAEFRAQGTSQGTGVLYAGQSSTYGGGIFYNGDGSPAYATGETADRISFFRRNNGTNTVVFEFPYNSDTVTFKSTPTVNGTNVSVDGHGHSYLPTTGGTLTDILHIVKNLGTPANYYNSLHLELNADSSGTAGLSFHRPGYSHVGVYHDTTNVLKFQMNSGTVTLNYNTGTIWGSGNDGSGSGLDADKLDGYHASSFHINGYGNSVTADAVYADNWFRARYDTGLYFEDKGTGVWSIQSSGGWYGSVASYGKRNSWGGFSCEGRAVFMHDSGSAWGIYNDVNDEWLIYGQFNGASELRYNNGTRVQAVSDGCSISGKATADGVAYFDAVCGGSGNKIAFRWVNPYGKMSIDNVICATAATFSDERIKTNIQSWSEGIGLLRQLRPVTYQPRDIIGFGEVTGRLIEGVEVRDETLIGLIAQEVKQVIPSAVTGNAEGTELMSILEDQIIAVVISAIQNIDTRLLELENA